MGNLSAILSTGQQALRAQQAALQVVGQNIANVNTPGYSRQSPVFVPTRTALSDSGFRAGVEVADVSRAYDRFITTQVNTANSQVQSTQTQADLLGHLETVFNDLQSAGAGLSGSLAAFFQGFEDLANNPQSATERTVVLQRGETVSTLVQQLQGDLETLHGDLNTALEDGLVEVNRLASEIADLNKAIGPQAAVAAGNANTLRDQRDLLVQQLSGLVGITSFETSEGLTVTLGGGRPLVEGPRASSLETRADANDPQRLLVDLRNSSGVGTTEVTTAISSGRLQGVLITRDTTVSEAQDSLDRFAAQLTSAVNTIHSQGFGLDGSTGTDFFTPRQVTAQAVAENTGGASVQSATVFDPTQLTLDDYQITFTANGPPATFDLVNTTTGSSVATGQSYSAGAAITFAGVDVRLTDTGTPPLAGDTFRISTTRNAARNLALNPTVAADAQKVAAAQSTLPGDNTNALALSAVGNTTLIDGTTLDGFYTALVTRIGAESQQQSSLAEQQQLVSSALSQRREAISGVSLEEEQIDLIRFQQAFGAAAELIKVADELADTVLGLVR